MPPIRYAAVMKHADIVNPFAFRFTFRNSPTFLNVPSIRGGTASPVHCSEQQTAMAAHATRFAFRMVQRSLDSAAAAALGSQRSLLLLDSPSTTGSSADALNAVSADRHDRHDYLSLSG